MVDFIEIEIESRNDLEITIQMVIRHAKERNEFLGAIWFRYPPGEFTIPLADKDLPPFIVDRKWLAIKILWPTDSVPTIYCPAFKPLSSTVDWARMNLVPDDSKVRRIRNVGGITGHLQAPEALLRWADKFFTEPPSKSMPMQVEMTSAVAIPWFDYDEPATGGPIAASYGPYLISSTTPELFVPIGSSIYTPVSESSPVEIARAIQEATRIARANQEELDRVRLADKKRRGSKKR